MFKLKAKSPSEENQRNRLKSEIFIWTAVALSAITCGIITWQHFSQAETLAQTRQLVTNVRLARIDLADGVLNLMLSDDRYSPFTKEDGLALLDQSVQEFNDAQAAVKQQLSPENDDKVTLETFANELSVFREQLSEYRDSAPSVQNNLVLPLLLSFHKLDEYALRTDTIIRKRLDALTQRQHREFILTLVVAALLVATMCLGAFQAKKSQKAAARLEQRNQALIRESEDRRALAMEAAKAGTWELDIASGKNTWSDEVWRLYGLEKGSCEPSRDAWLSTIIPEDREGILDILKETESTGKDYQLEWRVKNLSGGISWLLTYSHPFRDEIGQITRYTGVVIDITERKQAEETLRKSAEQLRLFVEHAPAPIAMFDRQMIYLAASRRWLTDYNITKEATIGHCHYEIFPDLPDSWKIAHQRGMEGEGSRSDEDSFMRADGTMQWLRWEIQPWRTSSGDVGGIIILTDDITAIKKSEDELVRSKGKLEATLNALPHLLVELDDTGTLIDYRTPAGTPISPVMPGFIGKRSRDIFPPETAEAFERAIDEAWSTGKHAGSVFPVEVNGSLRWFELSISQKPEPDKPKPHLILLAQDITERRREEKTREAIYKIAQAAHAASSLEDLYATIYATIGEVMKAENFFILLRDEGSRRIKFAYAVDQTDRVHEGDLLPHDEHGLTEHVLRTAEPLIFRISETTPELHNVLDIPIQVYIGAPLIIQGKADGAIILQNLEREDAYTEGDLRILTFVSSQVAAAIDQRRSADALKRNQALLEQAQAIAGLGSFEVNLETGATSCTRQMYSLYGLDPSDAPLTPEQFNRILELLHPDDRTALDAAFSEVVTLATPRTLEYRTNPERGLVKHLQVSMIPETDAQGKVIRITGTALDITAVKRAQHELERRVEERTAELRRSEETYHSLFEDSSDAILLAKTDGSATDGNRAAIALLGYTLEDYRAMGTEVLERLSYEGAPNRKELFDKAIAGETIPPFEMTVVAKDGRPVEMEISISTLRDSAGRITHLQLVARNITARKQAEAALLESRDQLEKANEALQNAARVKDEFFANMSHEIRTPMNAIIGLSGLALKASKDAQERDYVQKIHNAGVSLLGVINDILDFSKIEAGKLVLENIDFDLDTVIDELGTIMSQKLMDKDLELVLHLPPRMPRAWRGDPLKLGQILVNLVSNAVKFTDRGEVELTISIAENMGKRSKLLFEVRDTGIGMSDANIKRLFQAFSQADSSTTRRFGGTGLGLSISKRLVELMGGRIWAESEEGKGSIFRFTAWLEEGTGTPSLAGTIPEGLAGARVLVVDDNATAREVGGEIMAGLRFRVDSAASGEEALQRIDEAYAGGTPYEIILMDYYLGSGIDGIEATRRIRDTAAQDPKPAIFMVTGSAGESARTMAEEAGVNVFLLKPLTTRLISTAIERHFAPAEAPREPAPGKAERKRNLAGLRVLLVEDIEINRLIARELLGSAGIEVVEAHDGEEAVALFEQDSMSFDLILMDIQMPGMDGYQATKAIKANVRSSGVPIVAMTAYAMESDRQKALDAGMNAHIAKPIEPEVLYETIGRLCGRRTETIRPPQPAASLKRESQKTSKPSLLPAFDAKAGLAVVEGNRALYLDLLRKFRANHLDAAVRIKDALAHGDTTAAERIAHTLKGLSGNIGARDVQEKASELEALLRRKAGNDETGAAVRTLEKSIKAARKDLDEMLEANARSQRPTPKRASESPEQKDYFISELLRLVKASDTEALHFFKERRPAPGEPADKAAFDTLGALLEAFDFRKAGHLLESMRKREGGHS
jgi:PAS domain S-box-containing protein